MWEAPPPDTAGRAVGDRQAVLTPAAIEAALADFRSWLHQLSATAPADQAAEEQSPAIDLHTLLGQSIALRHDVNLQTKAARSGQEQTGQALQQLSQAFDALRQAQAAAQQTNQQALDEALRPLLRTLLDVHDAFSLAEREIRRAPETILPLLDELVFEIPPSENGAPDWETEAVCEPAIPFEADLDMEAEAGSEPAPLPQPKRSLWQIFFGRHRNQRGAGVCEVEPGLSTKLQAQRQRLLAKLQEQQQALVAQQQQYQRLLSDHQERQRLDKAAQQERQEKIERASERLGQLIDSVVTGYGMSLQRLERALEQFGLEPISCVGEPFDPEQMEVVAAVADSGRPAGEVIEEVRRGYLWHDRVFRYAQVSVAKP